MVASIAIGMKYIKALDGIRGVAIILVMLFHFNYFLEVGWVGVQLFFVLSGYLITKILLQSKNNSLGYYLKKFYWRRTLRIFPLYYFYVIGISLLYLVLGIPYYFADIAPYLFTYTYNYYPLINGLVFDGYFTHFWSLSVEEQFYLFWPLLIFFLNPKGLKIAVLFIIILSPVFRYFFAEFLLSRGFESVEVGEIIYRLSPSQIDAFAIGALIPVFNLEKRKISLLIGLWLPFAIFLGLGLWNYFSIESATVSISSLGYTIGILENLQHVWSYTVINFVAFSLVLLIVRNGKKTFLNQMLSNSVLVSIGKISYGMYVYHWIIISALKKYGNEFLGNDVLIFTVYFVLTYFISWLSYNFFEIVFIKLKDAKYKANREMNINS